MGRPREFDPDVALGAALDVFWRKGFDGASLNDLTSAMGITRPSLYATFGNKEELFRKAFARYEAIALDFTERALAEPTARRVAERMLYGAADAQTDGEHPSGCLAIQSALNCSNSAEPIRHAVLAIRAAKHAALQARLRRACDEGDLAPGTDPDALVAYLSAVINGMAVLAGTGACRETLYDVARTALAAWPAGEHAASHASPGCGPACAGPQPGRETHSSLHREGRHVARRVRRRDQHAAE